MAVTGQSAALWRSFCVSKQFAARLVLCLVLCCIFIPTDSAVSQATSQIDTAIEQAIYLSRLEHRMDARALYKEIHPDARALISEKTVAGWYKTDFFPLKPQSITQILSANFVIWTWGVTGDVYENTAEITFLQPFETGVDRYVVTETVRLVEHQNGEWGWFFGRSTDFVDQQKAIHDPGGSSANPTQQPASQSSRASTSPSNSKKPTSSNQNCTLVELRPGYPGYRGLVTGLSQQWGGLADWECLETLERNHPQFKKAEQDRLNAEAARYLGINDEPDVWLWENWMAIEAERGLPVQCYSCLLLDPYIEPINTSITQDWTDVRIQVGFMDSTSAVDLYLPTAQMRNNFDDNYQLRAHAFLAAGPSANAIEVLGIYEGLGQDNFWYSFTAGEYIHDIGGYSWVTPNAYPEDQIFSAFWAVYSGTYLYPDMIRSSVISMLDGAIVRWQADLATGSTESLVDFLWRETTILDY